MNLASLSQSSAVRRESDLFVAIMPTDEPAAAARAVYDAVPKSAESSTAV